MCLSWSPKFEPELSSFHPSAIILASKLRDSIKVKRELESCQQKMEENSDIFDDFWGDDFPKEEKKKTNVN